MYPAKVLLFGEYIVLLGARALTLPLERFGGDWAWDNGGRDPLHEALHAFAHSSALAQIAVLDTASFRRDVARGLIFRSNIPSGYGLGSSGALCAATYDRYTQAKTTDLSELRHIFAQMEGHFHGKSSGLDPLTSYVRRPLLVAPQGEVTLFEQQPWQGEAPAVFLLDTGQPRQTGPLVQWFTEQSHQRAFANRLETTLLPAHEALLTAWQEGRAADVWAPLQQVSAFQLAHFQPMIPERWRQPWAEMLATGEVAFKLCGAGGGGFLLVFGQTAAAVSTVASQIPGPLLAL